MGYLVPEVKLSFTAPVFLHARSPTTGKQEVIPGDRVVCCPFSLFDLHSTMHVVPFLAVAVGVGLYYLLARISRVKHDPREPPLLPQTIPVVGHVIGMIRKKGQYYVQLR